MRWPGARSCAARATTVAKNGFRRCWLGLSGGIDSALVLAIAVDALGADNVTAVRMPSRYTADLSNDLADEQCATLGVTLLTVPIEKPFQGFLDALARAVRRPARSTPPRRTCSRAAAARC